MSYTFQTCEKRSSLMKKIKSKSTKAEVILARALWAKGVRYRKNYCGLPGKPDLVVTKYKIAIFVDGEFWHGKNWTEKKIKISNNRDYWIPKIEKNIKRDISNNEILRTMGWTVIRFWEKEIYKNLDCCISKVITQCTLASRRR